MKTKWIGLVAITLIAGAIVGYKGHLSSEAQASSASMPTRVLLVAELSEANNTGDSCSEIIHLVRAAHVRGVAVQELNANDQSDLIGRYHVMVIPTVLILDRNGKVVARFEGEGKRVVKAVRNALEQLR